MPDAGARGSRADELAALLGAQAIERHAMSVNPARGSWPRARDRVARRSFCWPSVGALPRLAHTRSSAEERVEFAQRLGQRRRERFELVRLGRVETLFFGGALAREGREGFDRLADRGPAQRPLVAVVVRRIDALGLSLDAGDGLDRAAVSFGDAGCHDARQRPVVALDAHDSRGGDFEIRATEVAYPD